MIADWNIRTGMKKDEVLTELNRNGIDYQEYGDGDDDGEVVYETTTRLDDEAGGEKGIMFTFRNDVLVETEGIY